MPSSWYPRSSQMTVSPLNMVGSMESPRILLAARCPSNLLVFKSSGIAIYPLIYSVSGTYCPFPQEKNCSKTGIFSVSAAHSTTTLGGSCISTPKNSSTVVPKTAINFNVSSTSGILSL